MKISHFVFLAIPLWAGMWTGTTLAQENASLFSENAPLEFPYNETFVISAYYSPLLEQEQYVTGSYEGDITLNGDGVLSADNTKVYPGMIAAPSKYAFGIKMGIPGLGIGAVHDRGGAIKSKEDTGQSYDRLDVWMGYGDEGLERALAWGKRTIEVTVYGKDDTISEDFYLENFSQGNAIIQKYLPFLQPKTFQKDIWYGSEGEKVTLLQKHLQNLGFLTAEITGFYGNETKNAVFQFQKSKGIVESEDDLGAGHFGIRTRLALERAVSELNTNAGEPKNREFLQTLESYTDLREQGYSFDRPLQKGDSGEEIRTLQTELRRLGYLRINPTGIFGEITEHAVFKLQQAWGLIADISTPGAGTIGPNTRSRLNAILGRRIESKRGIALKRNERMLAMNASNVMVSPSNHDSSHVTLREPFGKAQDRPQGDIATDLGLGDRGTEVEILQKALKALGFFSGLTSEYFGSATANAVLNFQLQYGIIENASHPAAGYAGPETRKILSELSLSS